MINYSNGLFNFGTMRVYESWSMMRKMNGDLGSYRGLLIAVQVLTQGFSYMYV